MNRPQKLARRNARCFGRFARQVSSLSRERAFGSGPFPGSVVALGHLASVHDNDVIDADGGLHGGDGEVALCAGWVAAEEPLILDVLSLFTRR